MFNFFSIALITVMKEKLGINLLIKQPTCYESGRVIFLREPFNSLNNYRKDCRVGLVEI
jgi:hypothetical protein